MWWILKIFRINNSNMLAGWTSDIRAILAYYQLRILRCLLLIDLYEGEKKYCRREIFRRKEGYMYGDDNAGVLKLCDTVTPCYNI
jgi:hypothetical protein